MQMKSREHATHSLLNILATTRNNPLRLTIFRLRIKLVQTDSQNRDPVTGGPTKSCVMNMNKTY